MSCEYTSTLYCHLMSFSAQKMTLYPRIILALFDVAALNCEPSPGLLIAVHFITANSNREIQFIARVESLISHLEVLSPISNRKGTFLKWHSHWGWVRKVAVPLTSLPPLPGATSLIWEMMIINITGWSLDLGSITNPPLVRSTLSGSAIQRPDQDFFMSEENIGGHGDKVKRDTGSGSNENHEFSFP